MRLLIYSLNYSPEPTGIGKYNGEMARWLRGRGHQVRVVCAPPYYPGWKVAPGHSAFRWRRETLEGVDVWRCPLYIPSRPTALRRGLHLLSFAVASFPVLLAQAAWRPDVVFAVEPPILGAPLAWLLARLTGAAAWLHVQDFELDAAVRLGILRVFGGGRALSRLEGFMMRRFDRVSSLSRSMVRLLSEKRVRPDRTLLFPNWVDVEAVRPSPEAGRAFRLKHGLAPGAFLALYSGSLGNKQGLETVLEASALPGATGISFVLVGDGPSRGRLEEEARRRGLAHVRFLPLVPEEELPGLLSAADIHLVVQRRGAADVVMPSKLLGILAVGGRCVVTAERDSELGALADRLPSAVRLCRPEDPASLAEALRAARTEGDPGGAGAASARAYAVEALSRDRIMKHFERDMADLSASRRGPRPDRERVNL